MATYSPRDVVFIYGTIIAEGFMDGPMIDVEANSESFKKHIGTQGEVSRIQMHDETAKAVCRLKHDSPTNQAFSAALNSDIANGQGQRELLIKYRDGSGDVLAAPEAWIMGKPKKVYSDDMEGREWMFDTGTAVNDFGVVGV